MLLVTEAHPEHPALDMALTGALLTAVARGEAADTIRVLRPGPTLAFGRLDRTRDGFARACRVAADHGREPVLRWGGGHAAAYDRDCVLVELIRREARVIGGLEQRFQDMAAFVAEGLEPLGVALELGELPGEYCPGRFSLHLPDGPKVAGIAQRIVRGASLTTAVIVVDGGDRLRTAIAAVYAALGLTVDAITAGALSDSHPDGDRPARPSVAAQAAMDALGRHARARLAAEPGAIGSDVSARAAAILPTVTPPAAPRPVR